MVQSIICPKRGCERPQNTGKHATQAQFAILVFLKKDLTSVIIAVLFALNKFYQNFTTLYKILWRQKRLRLRHTKVVLEKL
jgi:hypothetical protein